MPPSSETSLHDALSISLSSSAATGTSVPRVLIFGTGAIGAVYTYILHQAPATITAVCRSNWAAAKANGFTINSTLWGDVNVKPAAVVPTISEAVDLGLGPWDFVVVCAKSFPGATPSTTELIAPAVTEGKTTIVLIQNGIEIEHEYAELFPTNPLLSCIVYLPATQTASAVVSHREVEHLHIGTYPATAPASHKKAAAQFAQLIRNGGATGELHDDVQAERWKKLLVNASWNPICALSRSCDAEVLHSSPQALEYVRNVMLEVAAVAQAADYPMVDETQVDLQIGRAKVRSLPGIEPSMMADARAGRRMEVEAIVGNVLRIARLKGVHVPLLGSLYVLLKALDGSSCR